MNFETNVNNWLVWTNISWNTFYKKIKYAKIDVKPLKKAITISSFPETSLNFE